MIPVRLTENQARLIVANCIAELETSYIGKRRKEMLNSDDRTFLLLEPRDDFDEDPELVTELQDLALTVINAEI